MADSQKTVKIIFEVDGEQQVVNTFEDVGKAAKKAGDETKKATEEGSAFGMLKDRIGGILKPLKGVVTGMKTLKGALISTGIGAFVVAIGTLIAYFQNSEEGSKKLAIAMETLSILFGKLTDFAASLGEKLVGVFTNPKEALLNFGNLIKDNIITRFNGILNLIPNLAKAVEQLFKGNFSEAGKIAANAVGEVVLGVENVVEKTVELGETVVDVYQNQIVPAVKEATAAATELVNTTRALRDEQQKLIVDNANLNKELETQQKIAEDTTLAYDERKAALERVGEAQVQLAENLARQAELEESLIQQQLVQEGNYEKREELETQLAEATAARIEAETSLELQKQDAQKITRELELEEIERKRSIRDILEENSAMLEEDQFAQAARELEIAERSALEQLDLLKSTEEDKTKIEESFKKKREKLAEEEAKFKQLVNEEATKATLSVASDAFGAIASLAGEGSSIAKAASIAQTTIDTYSSATAAYKSVVGIPVVGPALAPIAAGVAVASGLASIKKIVATKLPGNAGGGGGGGSVPSIQPPRTPSFDPQAAIDGAGEGQDTDATVGIGEQTNQQPVIKAYVVAEEVTSNQEANKKINDLARL